MKRSSQGSSWSFLLAAVFGLAVATTTTDCRRAGESSGVPATLGRTVSGSEGTVRRADPALDLPRAFGMWTRTSPPRRIEGNGIFDYMDGGGELYLAYGYQSLDVYEYRSPDKSTIVVEIYALPSSDDAFGLLSGDWGGEDVILADSLPSGFQATALTVPSHRALYGAGLLRLWADRLYARVLASVATPASRDQVIAIGRVIAAGRPSPPPPAMVAKLPPVARGGYSLRPDRVVFFRSYLVLNTAYYLAPQDLLGLDSRVEAVYAVLEKLRAGTPPARLHLIVVRYGDATAASQGWARFRAAYLPEHGVRETADREPSLGAVAIEDGWLGHRLQAGMLALVFEAPDRAIAAGLADDAVRRLATKEP